MRVSTKAVEIAGRNWLTSQLLVRGFNVAIPEIDEGIDVIVFKEIGAAGIAAMPLQLKCASAEGFSLDRKYVGRGIPIAYVWNVLGDACCYLMDYDEAQGVLGEKAVQTASWARGYYAFNHISADLRARLEPYRDRWDWVESRLQVAPVS